MTESPHSSSLDAEGPGPRRHPARLIMAGLLAVLVLTAVLWLRGRGFFDREHLQTLGVSARGWVDANPVSFVLMFVAAYVACAVLLLPVWWLQMTAGFAFGLWVGLAWVMVGSTAGALATAAVARWLGEDFVRARVIDNPRRRRAKPGMMDRTLALVGRNGLLVVLICRLSYPVPYGVSNYLFGLTGIKLRDIALGTAVGGLPVYAGWVAAGARPEWLGRWEFWVTVIGTNLLILGLLVARSRRTTGRGETAKPE